ncbi:MAG: hypothetical protein K2N91_06210, partial [Muribaculaceae bacterium]|nr:hypothetical protein [Muribaculaceae bacterium]
MKKVILFAALLAIANTVLAQSYYDDDIYFDASKAKKEKKEQQKNTRVNSGNSVTGHYVTTADGTQYFVDENGAAFPLTVINTPGSDTYIIDTGNNRDVDEYNRRNLGGNQYYTTSDSISAEDFVNTRRIEMFS